MEIATIEQLEAIYGVPLETSTAKEIGWLTPEYRMIVEARPSPRSRPAVPKASTARRAAIWPASCASPTSAR